MPNHMYYTFVGQKWQRLFSKISVTTFFTFFRGGLVGGFFGQKRALKKMSLLEGDRGRQTYTSEEKQHIST